MPTTLQQAASLIVRALEPLAYALEGGTADSAVLLAQLGWQLPTVPQSLRDLSQPTGALSGSLGALDIALDAAGDDGEDDSAVTAALVELAVDLATLATALHDLPAQLRAQLPAAVITATGIDTQFQERLFHTLLDVQLEKRQPLVAAVMQLLGLREVTEEEADPAKFQTAFTRRRLRPDRLPTLLTDPSGLARDVYGWGTPALDTVRLFDALLAVGFAVLMPGRMRYPGHEVLEALDAGVDVTADADLPYEFVQPLISFGDVGLAIGLLATPPRPPQAQGLVATLLGTGALHGELPLGPGTVLHVDADMDLSTGLSVILRPGQDPQARFALGGPGASEFLTGRLAVRLEHGSDDPAEAIRLLSITDGSRIEAAKVHIGLSVEAHGGPPELAIEGGLTGGRFVFDGAGADSFVSTLLPSDGITVNFDLGAAWSRSGLSLTGSAGTEIEIPVPLRLGPLHLESLHLALAAGGEGLTLEASVTGGAALGPLTATVDRVGAGADLAFRDGNLGPVDLGGHFKPPNGIGISIDASVVRGGGYLFFDVDKAQYAGVLHLEFEKLVLNAFGLLTTRLPDGSDGFSLLVIVQASGFTPIQLGFGFTLTGVGGLLGINRSVNVDVLRAGVRNKALDSILFSTDDPVPRAPQIISTLQSVFPPAVNQYVFGPMVQIGWGTPTLITVELAVILELPSPIRLILLGRVRAALPDPDHAIIAINLDVIGIVDFGRKELSVDASLYDSRVGPFAISGDMATRVNWGDNPSFTMSLGGFHPAFKPPDGFPELRRLTIALSTSDNPRLRMESYFALTSNTVQAGARLELYVGVAGFALEGGLGFDTLIQFSPFRIIAEIFAHLALKRGSTTLMGLDIHVNLTGPAPWVLSGEARFKIFIFHFSIPFHAEFGRREDAPAIERTEVWPVLRDSLTAEANWSAQLPPTGGRLVVLREGISSAELLAHPLGTLSVAQNLVPLERRLELFGSVPPKDFDRFAIGSADGLTLTGDTTDYFAPAQFRKMSDAEKLASPAFERMVSGARLAPAEAVAVGYVQETPLDYEQSIILDVDQLDAERPPERYVPDGAAVSALAEHGPAGTAAIRTEGSARYAPAKPGPAVADPVYVLVAKDALTAVPGVAAAGYTALAEQWRRRPDRDELQIVRAEERV
jgi:hypothetical protein